jgi:NitT/TauT family transport system ATP-binding protein
LERTAVAVRALSKTYPGDGPAIAALCDIELEIKREEFVAIVGPTGCGKTTLLRIVAGLIPPTGGMVEIGGRPVRGPNRRVGLVLQRPALLPWRTVCQNLSLPAELVGARRADSDARIQALLEATGLDLYRHVYPRELSVGMQQIVSFCVALTLDPEVLLMDEPFSALDALTRERLGETLLDLWTSYRKTVLFVTHSIPEAVFLSDRVVVLSPRPGRVIESVPVSLPRPRSLALIERPEFLELTTRVRRSLSDGGHGRRRGSEGVAIRP